MAEGDDDDLKIEIVSQLTGEVREVWDKERLIKEFGQRRVDEMIEDMKDPWPPLVKSPSVPELTKDDRRVNLEDAYRLFETMDLSAVDESARKTALSIMRRCADAELKVIYEFGS